MEALARYRQLVRRILTEYAEVPYAHGDVRIEPVFDGENDRYLLMIVGRENDRRVHGCLVHVDIRNGKFWIERDGTERGIANVLVEAGVPKDQIVLGFRSPEVRKHTEFAVTWADDSTPAAWTTNKPNPTRRLPATASAGTRTACGTRGAGPA